MRWIATALDLESRLEVWLARDISVLSADLSVIGRQVETAFGGVIDLLCVDRSGDLVVVELKRDNTPCEITLEFVFPFLTTTPDSSNLNHQTALMG